MYKQCNQQNNQTTKQPDNETTKQQDNETTKQRNNKTTKRLHNKICLEDNTESSESNPGRSLGIYEAGRDSCLEDSTKTYKDIEITKRIINKVLSSRQLIPYYL